MRLLTWNVNARATRRGEQAAFVVSREPDVVALQEVRDTTLGGLRAGRALMYSLNRDHLATPALEPPASMRRRFLEGVEEALSDLDPPPVSATLFGSAARGDGDVSSDIDLLIVRRDDVEQPAWDRQIDAVAERIRRMTGNPVGVHQIERSDLERLATDRPAIVAELERDVILVLGEPVDALIRAAAPR